MRKGAARVVAVSTTWMRADPMNCELRRVFAFGASADMGVVVGANVRRAFSI